MLTNFEDLTKPLTDTELQLVPIIAAGLRRKIGKHMAVTATQITDGLAKQGHRLPGPRVRAIIHHIRVEGIVPLLCSSSAGYYVGTADDVRRTIQSQEERIRSQQAAVQALKKQYAAQCSGEQIQIPLNAKAKPLYTYPD